MWAVALSPLRLLVVVAAAGASSVVELPALRRAAPPDDQPYAVASVLSGDSLLLNSFFGTSFGSELEERAVHADLCLPLGESPAPALLFFAPGAAASTGAADASAASPPQPPVERLPLAALAMADVWLATLPLEGGGECAWADAACCAAADALTAMGERGGVDPPRQLVLLVCEREEVAAALPAQEVEAAAARTPRYSLKRFFPWNLPSASQPSGDAGPDQGSDPSRGTAESDQGSEQPGEDSGPEDAREDVAQEGAQEDAPEGAAQAAERCARRFGELLDLRLRGAASAVTAASGRSPPIQVSPPILVSHVLVGRGGGSNGAARELLAMLLQPGSARYLLRSRPPFGSAAVPVGAATALLRALVRVPRVSLEPSAETATPPRTRRGGGGGGSGGGGAPTLARARVPLPLPATAAEWSGLHVCLERASAAMAEASRRAGALRAQQEEENLNPRLGLGAQLDAMTAGGLAAFDGAAAAYAGTGAFSDARAALRRGLSGSSLRLCRAQLGRLRTSGFEEFCGELVERMHAERKYERAAAKLSKAHASRFRRAAATALPSDPATRAAAEGLLARARLGFERQLAAEVTLRAEEGRALEEQCPMASDDAPTPWYKQIATQLLAAAFNGAQFYLVQYLPAKRKDLADERALPRGPVF